MSTLRNLKIASAFNFFQMCLVVVPVLVPYWSSLGLSISEILQIQAAFGISVALFEVPTGYIADLWSRKLSICLGAFISGCCFTFLPFATSYESLMLFEICIGFAAALSSGADSALVYDSLPDNSSRLKLLGSIEVWAYLGETVAALAAGVIVLWSLAAVTYVQAVISWVPFILALFFVEPQIERMEHKGHFANCGNVIKFLVVDDSLIRLVFLNAIVWGLSSFCVVWLQQAYWSDAGVPTSYFGLIWAALMLVAAASSKYAHSLERIVGAPFLLLVLAVAPCVGYFLMAAAPVWIGVGAAILFYITRGLSSVILQDAFNWKVPSNIRATANSLKSLGFRLGGSVVTPLVGLVSVRWGLGAGLFLLGVLFSMFLAVLMRPLFSRMQELRLEYIPS